MNILKYRPDDKQGFNETSEVWNVTIIAVLAFLWK
jgi:hypothetical protein